MRLLARSATSTFDGLAKQEHKVRSSVYTTASLALDPWLEPSVAHSASDSALHGYSSDKHFTRRPKFIDLEWLMGGGAARSNTLYLTASQPEFERLSPVLGGMLASIKDSIHEWDIDSSKLQKPLLIVIDEAGQLELGWLPGEVSTITTLGAFLSDLLAIPRTDATPLHVARRRRVVRPPQQVLLRRHRRPGHRSVRVQHARPRTRPPTLVVERPGPVCSVAVGQDVTASPRASGSEELRPPTRFVRCVQAKPCCCTAPSHQYASTPSAGGTNKDSETSSTATAPATPKHPRNSVHVR